MSNRMGLSVIVLAISASSMGAVETFGATIISDSFTVANGSFIPGGTPETGKSPTGTNLPGGTYKVTGGGGGDGRYNNNTGQMHNGGGVGIELGTYNDNAVLNVSADISFLNTTATIQTSGYALLGFFSVQGNGNYSPSSSLANFTGLRVNLDGSMQLVVAGSLGSAIQYGGTFDQPTARKLSYTVDTATGTISNVTYGTSGANYNFSTTGITVARTELFGIGGSLNNSPNYAVFDNLLLETAAVPEPATIGLVAALTPLALRRRRGETA